MLLVNVRLERLVERLVLLGRIWPKDSSRVGKGVGYSNRVVEAIA